MSLANRRFKLIRGYCRIESSDMIYIIDDIISIIFEYQKLAKWSKKHKGKYIDLSEDDTKAICTKPDWTEPSHSVCADFYINRGQSISWELECKFGGAWCNFMGVVSSQITDFSSCPARKMKNAYGVDDSANGVYLGQNYYEAPSWSKPRFPIDMVFTIKINADWTEKQCKLTFYYQGIKLNDENDEYTMLLPEIDDEYVWYPCVTPYNKKAYCIIRYV